MADFPGMITTAVGDRLQALAQIGTALQFTRVALGDGAAPDAISPLTGLVNEQLSIAIQSMDILGDGTARIRVILTNQNVDAGFFIREIGLFATDPATNQEVLYSYTNAGASPDFLPGDGGATMVEYTFDLLTVTGNAQNVTAVINQLLTLATKQDITALEPRLLPDPADQAPNVGDRLRIGDTGDPEWVDPATFVDPRLAAHTRFLTGGL